MQLMSITDAVGLVRDHDTTPEPLPGVLINEIVFAVDVDNQSSKAGLLQHADVCANDFIGCPPPLEMVYHL